MTPRTATAAATDGTVAVVPLAGEGARVVRRGPSTRRKVATWGMRGAMVGALAAGGLYVAYLTLPTATVTLTPGTTTMTPVGVSIVASTNAIGVDPMAGTIHADWRQYPLSATDTFKATGSDNVLTAAKGEIRVTSKNTVTQVVMPQGAVVSTGDGRQYRTQRAVRLEKWSGEGERPSATVAVEATKLGASGNTGRDTVRNVSPLLERQGVIVTNPEPITGGSSTRQPVIKREDCENAQQTLTAALETQLQAELAKGPEPADAVLFPDSAGLGAVTFQPTCADLVRQRIEQFELSALATGSALQVDETDLVATAEEHFRLTTDVVGVDPATIQAEPAGEPVVDVATGTVTYPLRVSAQVNKPYDPIAIKQQIAGQPVEVARRLLLEWGDATLQLWPDFVPNVPTDTSRITLTNTQQ